VSDPSERTTGGSQAGAEQDDQREGPAEGAPPWARGGTSTGANGSGIDVGQPEHGSESAPASGSGSAADKTGSHQPEEWTGTFTSGGDPTSRFEPAVPLSGADTPAWGGGAFDQSAVRTGTPMFENRPDPEPPPMSLSRPTRVPRRASLQLKRLDPWSVLKLSLVLSVAGFLVWLVAVGVLYGVLDGMGVWDQINGTYSDLTSVNEASGGEPLISAGRVFGVAMLVGVLNIILMTALATVGALIYNVASDLVGGAELTLSERD
jgi:hypothetical protein